MPFLATIGPTDNPIAISNNRIHALERTKSATSATQSSATVGAADNVAAGPSGDDGVLEDLTHCPQGFVHPHNDATTPLGRLWVQKVTACRIANPTPRQNEPQSEVPDP